jgi:hypothetical protein
MERHSILSKEEKEAMCTDDFRSNGGAQIRWAIGNDFCTSGPDDPIVNC